MFTFSVKQNAYLKVDTYNKTDIQRCYLIKCINKWGTMNIYAHILYTYQAILPNLQVQCNRVHVGCAILH